MDFRWIHPAFSGPEHGMFLSYHGYKTQCLHYSASFNIQAYPLSGFILLFLSRSMKCFYHTMDIRLNVRITQPCSISRHALSLNSSCIFVPDSLSVPIIPCSLSCSKYFASEKADIKAGTVSSHSYICRHRDVSVSLMFLGFKKALCFLYHYAA